MDRNRRPLCVHRRAGGAAPLALEWGSSAYPAGSVQPLQGAHRVFFAAFAALLGGGSSSTEFSMHTFYRNRLTRCYLGASNKKRNPLSPITSVLHERAQQAISPLEQANAGPKAYPGPMPIFCCTMNITTGENLAWQERKAASFVFTPLYSGYTVGWTEWRKNLRFNGFVPTAMLVSGRSQRGHGGGGFGGGWLQS